jgi:hypothetical protein
MRNLLFAGLAMLLLLPSQAAAGGNEPDAKIASIAAAPITPVTTTAPPAAKPAAVLPFFDFPWADIGVGYWHTNSKLNSYVYAPADWVENGSLRAYQGDVISKLRNKLGSEMLLINAEAHIFWRLYVDGFVGLGDFGGEHKDYDWQPQERPDLISLSASDADGIVRTWNVNGNIRLLEDPRKKFYLDLALGYLFYRDDITHLHNTTLEIAGYQQEYTWLAGHNSSDKYTFQGFRIGLRGKMEVLKGIAVKANAGVVPGLTGENRGYWNLREIDFLGDTNGVGCDLTGGLEFSITKHLSIEGGYKYMRFITHEGDQTTTTIDGTTKHLNGCSFDAERGGFYVMGRIRI